MLFEIGLLKTEKGNLARKGATDPMAKTLLCKPFQVLLHSWNESPLPEVRELLD